MIINYTHWPIYHIKFYISDTLPKKLLYFYYSEAGSWRAKASLTLKNSYALVPLDSSNSFFIPDPGPSKTHMPQSIGLVQVHPLSPKNPKPSKR